MQELLAEAAPRFRNITSIMKDPEARKRLNAFIDEAVKCKQEILAKNEQIKGLRKLAIDELKLNPKLFNAYVSAAFNNDYGLRLDAANEMVDLLETIMAVLPGGANNPQVSYDEEE